MPATQADKDVAAGCLLLGVAGIVGWIVGFLMGGFSVWLLVKH